MERVDEIIKGEFEKILIESGFIQTNDTENIYQLTRNNNPDRIITIQLIGSEKIDSKLNGSHNGNEIQSIGYFRFEIPPTGVNQSDFFIFGFNNLPNDCVEFIIVPYNELIERLQYRNRNSPNIKEIELVFWLMPDSNLYETTNIGSEGEFFFLSKGYNGRMADIISYMNYTENLNGWNLLSVS